MYQYVNHQFGQILHSNKHALLQRTGGRVIGNVQKLERLGFFGKQVVPKTAVNDASSIDYQHLAKIHWDSLQEGVLDDKNDSLLRQHVVQVVVIHKNY